MDFLTALGVLRRRWRVLLVGALLTAAAAMGASVAVTPSYSARGDFLLLMKHQSIIIEGQRVPLNPYLNFEGGLTVTAETLIQWLNGDEAQRSVEAAGGTGQYEATGFEGSAPLISLDVKADSPEAVLHTTTLYAEQLAKRLETIQANADVRPRDEISLAPVQLPIKPQPDQGSRLRAVVAVTLVGLLLTLFAAFTRERLAMARVQGGSTETTE